MEKLADLSINETAFFILYEFLSNGNIVKIAHNVVLESTFAYAAGIVRGPSFRHHLRGADNYDNDDSNSRAESLWYMQCAVNGESFLPEINGINRSDLSRPTHWPLCIRGVNFVFVRS